MEKGKYLGVEKNKNKQQKKKRKKGSSLHDLAEKKVTG